ncbi:hypothetical protein [Flavihumibacter profundi]|uniref:hypothetical protein n=1 Tax=Flavihumibacter profundi TaxID=2716883 RepID=UPI001CC7C2EE|nr:hypothetical protein [Flavihumibacter profundi]MBZ5857555.1 hypothetical protein [Flavihumibacter profundi]
MENSEEKIKALDELFKSSASYRNSENFFELIKFIKKFPLLSPYNAFLIHMQNRGVEIVLSYKRWRQLGRTIKYDARPMLILVPFGPIEFVYDIADTEGAPIPEALINPFNTNGELKVGVLERTIKNCVYDEIYYQEENMHKDSAGYAQFVYKKSNYKIVVNAAYTQNIKFSTLVHELAHIYAGHLGAIKGSWWQFRSLDHSSKEIEAESISYLVCKRMNLQTTSEEYLSSYISKNRELPYVSLDVILTVANYIEQLGQPGFRPKKKRA